MQPASVSTHIDLIFFSKSKLELKLWQNSAQLEPVGRIYANHVRELLPQNAGDQLKLKAVARLVEVFTLQPLREAC